MWTSNYLPDVHPFADTDPIIWNAVDSDRSNKHARTVEAEEIIQTPAERELQAAQTKARRRAAKNKKVDEKRRRKKLRQRFAEE